MSIETASLLDLDAARREAAAKWGPDLYAALSSFGDHGPASWDWQEGAFLRSAPANNFCYFSEPRCGKSKPALRTAAWRFLLPAGHPMRCDALAVVAMPYNVPVNWIKVEVPRHVPPECRPATFHATTERLGTVGGRADFERFLRHDGLAILVTNGEAVLQQSFLVPARRFFKTRALGLLADESSLIMKGWGGKRQQKMWAMRRMPNVRWARVLDGSPTDGNPVDFFSQVGFLSKSILGFQTFAEYERHYCELEVDEDSEHKRAWTEAADEAERLGLGGDALVAYADRQSEGVGRRWTQVRRDADGAKMFKNLPALWEDMAPHSVRVRRRDVYDGPAKVYQRVPFELTRRQREVYDRLAQEYEVELSSGPVSVANILTRYMRLQQVARNYFPNPKVVLPCPSCDGSDDACPACEGAGYRLASDRPPEIIDPNRDAAVEALREAVRKGQRTVVWCRFQYEAEALVGRFRDWGWDPRPFHGGVRQDAREEYKDAFNAGRLNPLVGTPRTGSRGVTIAAECMAFFNNEYSLLTRLQTEDRPEVPGLPRGVEVLDLVALDTKDEDIISALVAKRSVADVMFRERSGKWL